MAYKVCLSNKSEIKIDHDELPGIVEGIESGARLIKVRSGMFNPSFIVCIELDENRLEGLKFLPKKLPDMFQRIGGMTQIGDVISDRIEIGDPKEILPSPDEVREMIDRNKPEFLKHKN